MLGKKGKPSQCFIKLGSRCKIYTVLKAGKNVLNLFKLFGTTRHEE